MPQGERGEMNEPISRSHTNMFQGRYIILHRSKKKLECSEGETPQHYWRGPAGKSDAPKPSSAPGMTASSKKTKYKLSKDVQKQVRAQIKAQEDIE